mgnify:CR=1 FL=1
MAKKKRGFGRIFGAITGSPYERLLKQVDKVVNESGSDRALAKTLKKLVKTVSQQYEEGNIDEEEHDLVLESIEEADPEGRSFPKLTDDSDAFYDDGDMPDSPELKLGKRKNLDDLLKSQGNEFTGSFGRDEFEDGTPPRACHRTVALIGVAQPHEALVAEHGVHPVASMKGPGGRVEEERLEFQDGELVQFREVLLRQLCIFLIHLGCINRSIEELEKVEQLTLVVL